MGLHKPIANKQNQPTDFTLDVPNMKDMPGTRAQPEWILHFSFTGLPILVKPIYSFQSVIKMKCDKGGKHLGGNRSSSPKKKGRLYFLSAFA